MGIKKFKPITPGQRHKVSATFEEITASKPEKTLVKNLGGTGGRNNLGARTTRYVGGGHKKQYRIIDFSREKFGIPAVVKTIEYDPYRTARIALVFYKDGEKRYIIAPKGLKVGQTIESGPAAPPEVGNALPLSAIPLGSFIHNVELTPGQGAALARSAGSSAQLLAREDKYVTVKLPSGEMRLVLSNCMATIGSVSNEEHINFSIGKAGRNRWLGKRPRNRGVAMNPVDHPMGGGEGKASGGHPRSRNGLYAKGLKTRKPNKFSNSLIISKRSK